MPKKSLYDYCKENEYRKYLLEEWYQNKNENLTPSKVTPKSEKKVWWKCSICGNIWKAVIYSRTSGKNCPKCGKENNSSFPEQAIYFYIKQIYPKTINNSKEILNKKLELDIYIPEINTAIEYDGLKWHKDTEKDLLKNEQCNEAKIKLIRIREKGLENIKGSINLFRENKDSDKSLEEVLKNLFSLLEIKIDINIQRDRQLIYSTYIKRKKTNSLAINLPHLIKEWHPTKNNNLTPENVSYNSHKKVWWICELGHEYEAIIYNKANGTTCPYCSNHKILKGYNDLASIYPELVKEWHPTKNGDLKPTDFTFGSNKKIWWICEKGHEWNTKILNRSIQKHSCPYCNNQLVLKGYNDLGSLYPHLIKEWHPTKNGKLTIFEITCGSDIKRWWKCSKCGYEYQRDPYTQKNIKTINCPKCSKIK